jgi:hypothetical protein
MSDTKQQDADESIPLDADGDVRLPVVDVLTGRGFITGKSGSGKSNPNNSNNMSISSRYWRM